MRLHDSDWYSARHHPESVGFDADLTHVRGWAALSITGSPQVVEVTLTNRTPRPASADAAELGLTFRPGVLTDVERLALAPQSESSWALSSTTGDDGLVHLVLRAAAALSIEPGQTIAVRLVGLSVAAAGGSRATRVQIDYGGFALAGLVDGGFGPEVRGSCLVHLPLVRRHAPAAITTLPERASTALDGPFFAGIVKGGMVLNDAKTANEIIVRLLNVSGRPLPLSADDDEATRFVLDWRNGVADANWGLLGADGSHLLVRELGRDFVVDRHTIRCDRAHTIPPGGHLDLELIVHTTAIDGSAELAIHFENLPGHDDGDLRLPVELGPVAVRDGALHIVRPIELRGDNAAITFRPAEEGSTILGDADVPRIAVDRSAAALGRLNVTAPRGVHLDGPVTATGSVSAATVVATGSVSAGSMAATGSVSARSVTATDRLSGASLHLAAGWRLSIPTGRDQIQFWKGSQLVFVIDEHGWISVSDQSGKRKSMST